jgi:hypothetical protein
MSGDIVADIDAALGCQQCRNPLGRSPSADFCTEECQRTWHGLRAAHVVGGRLLVDEELAAAVREQMTDVMRQCVVCWDSVRVALQGVADAFKTLGEALQPLGKQSPPAVRKTIDDRWARVIQARCDAQSGPSRSNRPPRRLDARRSR